MHFQVLYLTSVALYQISKSRLRAYLPGSRIHLRRHGLMSRMYSAVAEKYLMESRMGFLVG